MTLISMSYGEEGDGVLSIEPHPNHHQCHRHRHHTYRSSQLLEERLEVVIDLAFGEHFLREKRAGLVKKQHHGTMQRPAPLTSSGSVAWILSSISLQR